MSVDARDDKDTALPAPDGATADLRVVIDAMISGVSVSSEVGRRIDLRAEQVREELRHRGTTSVARDLIRECRDE